MAEVRRISALTLLRKLNLRSNPVRDLPDYRTAVIFSIGQLTELDGLQIGIDEKVNSVTAICSAYVTMFCRSLLFLGCNQVFCRLP
jgi:hypothetical protein